MIHKRTLSVGIVLGFLTYPLQAEPVDISTLSGSWHLRTMDGNEVRKARAILEFDAKEMLLSGFDGCNQITGTLTHDTNSTAYTTKLMTTKMACREHIHSYVSQKLHETIDEGFTLQEEEKYGIEGITLKSSKHELFFKKMGKEKTPSMMETLLNKTRSIIGK